MYRGVRADSESARRDTSFYLMFSRVFKFFQNFSKFLKKVLALF